MEIKGKMVNKTLKEILMIRSHLLLNNACCKVFLVQENMLSNNSMCESHHEEWGSNEAEEAIQIPTEGFQK